VHTVHIREEVVRNEDSESIVQVCAERTKFAWVAGKTKRQVNALELDLSFVGGTIPRISCMSQKPVLSSTFSAPTPCVFDDGRKKHFGDLHKTYSASEMFGLVESMPVAPSVLQM
jgi:hypothetical protein